MTVGRRRPACLPLRPRRQPRAPRRGTAAGIVVLGALALVAAARVVHAASPAAVARTPAHYLVFEVQADGSARAVFGTRVMMRGTLDSVDPRRRARLTAPSRSHDHVVARLTDGAATVFEDVVTVPRWRRGEFPGTGPGRLGAYQIDARVVPEPTRAFVVRVPVVPGAALVLDSGALAHAGRFDPDEIERTSLATARVAAPPPPPPPLPGWDNGDPANRVDVLILGDGYTAAQQGQFDSDALGLANSFFDLSPYDDYRNYVNVAALFTPSAQSGADQPPYDPSCSQRARVQTCCSDSGASGMTPTMVATAFDATFCSFAVQRFLSVDNTKVLIAAAADPDWDEILVLVNSAVYGGSGGQFSVVSTNTFAVNLAQHEYGHTFTLLADEYPDPVPSFPPCSDVSTGATPCEPNVTDETTRSQIKWARWIAPSQPVPSTDAPPVETDAGLWKGARYQASGMYRQGFNCRMRTLFSPFCDVAAEAYALRLYAGGWGVPADGIDTIEPGTESPTPGSVSMAYPGGTFSATVLGPQTGPDVEAAWYLDGTSVATEAVASGGTASYALATTPGSHELELRVTDTSPIIHPTVRSPRTRTWNVTVGPDLCGNGALDPGETCDDGNVTPGDGCSTTCTVEPCWRCSGLPSACAPDDGAPCSDGDACSAGEACTGGSCGGGMPVTACSGGDGCCPAACTFATDGDCPTPTLVSGKKLAVKDATDPRQRSVAFETRDAALDTTRGSGIDPVANGLALQLYNADGTGESVCLHLPSVAGSWRSKGDPASPAFSYTDARGVNGPCKHAVVKDGKLLKISCAAKVQPIAYSLDEPAQHALAVRLVSGTTSYCALFGGTVKTDSGTDPPIAGGRGKFDARDAAAPDACPVPPSPCP